MKSLSSKFYLNTTIFGFSVFFLVCLYLLITEIGFGLEMINKSAGNTGVILIGLSFMLSGISFFWDFADKKLAYRKYLGIVGYFFIFWHFINSFYFYFLSNSRLYKFDLFNNWRVGGHDINNIWAFVLGLIGFLIFTFMALISNNYATRKLGRYWRPILRVGYIAIFAGMLHFSIKNFSLWVLWIQGGYGFLPPISFLMFIYIVIVLLLRLFLGFNLTHKRANS